MQSFYIYSFFLPIVTTNMLILLGTNKKTMRKRKWLIKNLKSNPISLFVLLFFFPNLTTIMLILLLEEEKTMGTGVGSLNFWFVCTKFELSVNNM